jgi:hypothetical protein
MNTRLAQKTDKSLMLTSFKPLFDDWDYLPLVIDEWLSGSSASTTWLTFDDRDGDKLIAMAQAYEIEPGDWYLRGLRSNPKSTGIQNAWAVLCLTKAMIKFLNEKKAKQVRYGTLDYFEESLRLANMLGFEEHFRLAHAHHRIADNNQVSSPGVIPSIPDNIDSVFNYLSEMETVKSAESYFFTWWDTRLFSKKSLEQARDQGLLFQTSSGKEITGASMFWHVPWQKFLVLSVMEGSYESLIALFTKAMERASDLGCINFGMVHPSHEEMYHRQTLFNLPNCGVYTVQLIRKEKG